jgi:hypothetical protein
MQKLSLIVHFFAWQNVIDFRRSDGSLTRKCRISIGNHSNKIPNYIQQSIVKFYYFVLQTLLNMFRALLCPSSGARQTAVVASGFRVNMEVDVFSAVVGLLCVCQLRVIKDARDHKPYFQWEMLEPPPPPSPVHGTLGACLSLAALEKNGPRNSTCVIPQL